MSACLPAVLAEAWGAPQGSRAGQPSASIISDREIDSRAALSQPGSPVPD